MTVVQMQRAWFGDHTALEAGHGFIQWLFPIHEKGLNWKAKPLQRHEAAAIAASPRARRAIIRSLIMMCDFFGVEYRLATRAASARELDDAARAGSIRAPVRCVRAANWAERSAFLNKSTHNYLRITRILKCLSEVGLAALKFAFASRLVTEAFAAPSGGCRAEREPPPLCNAQSSAELYWIPAFRSSAARRALDELRERLRSGGGAAAEMLAVTEGCSAFARAQRQPDGASDALSSPGDEA